MSKGEQSHKSKFISDHNSYFVMMWFQIESNSSLRSLTSYGPESLAALMDGFDHYFNEDPATLWQRMLYPIIYVLFVQVLRLIILSDRKGMVASYIRHSIEENTHFLMSCAGMILITEQQIFLRPDNYKLAPP